METIRDQHGKNNNDYAHYFYMKRFASFFTNDPEWSVKATETEMYDQWLLSERENLKAQIKSLNEEQRMLFEFIKGAWWNPDDPTPPKRHLLEIIGDAGKSYRRLYFSFQITKVFRILRIP